MSVIMNIFLIPELRKRLFFTLMIMIVIRIGAQIPVPGVQLNNLLSAVGSDSNSFIAFVNLLSGGALERASIFALGVMPYITSSIVMQLLTVIIPALEKKAKEGPEGRRKINQYARIGTLLIAGIQGIIYANYLVQFNANIQVPFILISSMNFVLIFSVAVATGTYVLMWLGEQISEQGLGNGISMIILSGIVARFPQAFHTMFSRPRDPIITLLIAMLFLGVIMAVIFEEMALRKVPVQYTRNGGMSQTSYLPFKVNPTNVIPIIFASAILVFPIQLAQWFGSQIPWLQKMSVFLQPGEFGYSILYFVLILFFAFFYIEIELNPRDISENLKRQNAFIPGVRPGADTEKFISDTLYRLTLPGASFLGLIALLPTFVVNKLKVPSDVAYLMGGTSLIILVGVSLNTLRQIESFLQMNHKNGFLSPKKRIY
ncbi:MAG: preprotein translocase subunit SecY [Brevinemataceae bacterium]